ncbi:MAG: DNA polymerase I [Bacteroidia bacterium]|nr:DNA polymerase I [Bacteroidia bacterium]
MSEKEDKRLFLLDAFALIYRAYFAFGNNQRVNSKGLNTSAVFGFANTLLEVLQKEKPTHIAVVFDTAAPTSRHEEFTDYKAHRDAMPDDIAVAIPYVKRLIEGFKIPVLESDGYEADDVIGTLAKKAEKAGYTTYMMTPDKDYGQLVSDHILMYKPAKFGNPAEVLGPKEICAKYNIQTPQQVIDILGLMGDSADNIPGIPGVGEKTAIKLISEYHSVENLLENAEKLTGSLKEKVMNNKDKAIMSKKLATILLDAPVEFEEDKLIMEEPDKEKLKELFTELEFRQIAKRVLGEEIPAEIVQQKKEKKETGQFDMFGAEGEATEENNTQAHEIFKTINDVVHTYHLVDTKEKRADLIQLLSSQKSFCFDTETTGLDVFDVEIVGLSFSVKKGEAYYVFVPENKDEAQQIVNEFKALLENEAIEKTGQNIKYDMSVLRNYGIEVRGKLFDTMIAHYILQPDMRHNMDVLSETYLGYSPVSITTLIGAKGKNQLSMRDVPVEKLVEYAGEDADVTLQLREVFEPMLEKDGTQKVFSDIEMPLVPVLAAMENEGIKLDTDALASFSLELQDELVKVQDKIYQMAGTSFNIASPQQLGKILFEHLKISDKAKKTKTGQYATGEDILEKLAAANPIVEEILVFRELQKLKNTYVDPLPTMINSKTGKIHTSYNQVVAATGRLSSDKPNLQNIPIRTEKGREVRKAFIARNDEFTILSADYSQIELRIIAELSEDAGMLEAFRQGLDIHSATASKVFNVAIDAVDKEMRRRAKAVNFGISYGQTAFGLSQTLNIPRKEATEIIDNYFAQYPNVRNLMDKNIAFAREHGYVETIMGRRRYLRDINDSNANVRSHAERNAINAPIQGSAADMIKIAMIKIHDEIKKQKLKSRLLLQVHDELVFDAHKEELDVLKPLIRDGMVNAIPMKVPIEVDMNTGKNWLEAH